MGSAKTGSIQMVSQSPRRPYLSSWFLPSRVMSLLEFLLRNRVFIHLLNARLRYLVGPSVLISWVLNTRIYDFPEMVTLSNPLWVLFLSLGPVVHWWMKAIFCCSFIIPVLPFLVPIIFSALSRYASTASDFHLPTGPVALSVCKRFPLFPRVVIFHAVPMSMVSSSYCAGHLWRGGLTHRISIQVFVPVYGGYQTVTCKCATELSRWLSFTCSFFSQPSRCLAVFAVFCARFGGTFLIV